MIVAPDGEKNDITKQFVNQTLKKIDFLDRGATSDDTFGLRNVGTND
jgi:hypothetical protein